MSDNLLPCPHCGGNARLIHYHASKVLDANANAQVGCNTCNIATLPSTDEDAIAAWNRRVPAPVPDVPVEAIRELCNDLDSWHFTAEESNWCHVGDDEFDTLATVRIWLDQQQEER